MDLVVLTQLPDITVTATSRLLKQGDAAAAMAADALLRQTRARSEGQRELLDKLQDEARQRGHAAGLRQAEEEMAHRLAAAHVARQVSLKELAPMLADIVVDAVAVLARGTPREALLAGAFDAVSGLLRQARWARLRVPPTALESARSALADMNGNGFGASDIVSIVADASLDADGCIFETDVGFADASLRVQLAAIRQAVEASLAHLPTPSPSAA